MSYTIRMNTMNLDRDAETVSRCITEIQQKMKEMEEAAAELEDMWDGPASQSFKAAFYDDMDALSVLIRNLEKIYKYEKRTGKAFDQCGQKVDGVLSGISW